MRIGPHELRNALAVAPMAGVTDRPFRQLCRRLGAGYAVSEMVTSNAKLWGTDKSRRRMDHAGEPAPVAVQIAGADPAAMAEAARHNVARGAAIIDINMGCPAKKVCNAAAGSALLSDEPLVARILAAVVAAVDVPVTLKIRTGPDRVRPNAPRIARKHDGWYTDRKSVVDGKRVCVGVGHGGGAGM
ncbi:MAG: tRNA-dihydrouridine synthase, partial [Burkholderiales bacterium]|nr:tRNA-dihydrouridine synthase [Burkholderiales bacterium]